MIERLQNDRRAQVIDVLAEAFYDYPAMRFMLGREADYVQRLSVLIGSYVDSRLRRDAPVLGIEEAPGLAAVALVDAPARPSLLGEFERAEETVREALGEDSWRRIEAFENAVSGLEPDEPHYYIGMIGVRDGHRGEGLARQLLDYVLKLSTEDTVSRSVCLSTEHSVNLPFYAHFGFEVIGDVQVDDLHSWTLRRDTSALRNQD